MFCIHFPLEGISFFCFTRSMISDVLGYYIVSELLCAVVRVLLLEAYLILMSSFILTSVHG